MTQSHKPALKKAISSGVLAPSGWLFILVKALGEVIDFMMSSLCLIFIRVIVTFNVLNFIFVCHIQIGSFLLDG